jgi:hypothetical protein
MPWMASTEIIPTRSRAWPTANSTSRLPPYIMQRNMRRIASAFANPWLFQQISSGSLFERLFYGLWLLRVGPPYSNQIPGVYDKINGNEHGDDG